MSDHATLLLHEPGCPHGNVGYPPQQSRPYVPRRELGLESIVLVITIIINILPLSGSKLEEGSLDRASDLLETSMHFSLLPF